MVKAEIERRKSRWREFVGKSIDNLQEIKYLMVQNPCDTANEPGSHIKNYCVSLIIPFPQYI